MALVDDFYDLYDQHTYKGGNQAPIAVNATALTNPRGLARAVDYSGDPLYPKVSEIVSGDIKYYYPAVPAIATLDALPPSFIDKYAVSRLPEDLRHSMIEASYLAKRPEVNIPIWKLGFAGISQLRVGTIIP